jgi:hypothetical protein
MSGGIQVSFIDLAAFSSEIDRVHCVLVMLFLVQNRCGGRATFPRNVWISVSGRQELLCCGRSDDERTATKPMFAELVARCAASQGAR